jgi:two-component sensor histidine kinase
MRSMQQLRGAVLHIDKLLKRSIVARYAATAALVLTTVGFRAAFQDVFSSGVYYHLYYPAVILAAYLFGAGPGVFSILLSAGLAYLFFAHSAGAQGYIPLVSFLGSSTVAVFVLVHVRHRLKSLTEEYERIDALTRSQADLFRTHAARVSDHLQLISALLQLQARDGGGIDVSRVLMNAASRTMLISRMHRTFAKEGAIRDDSIDFKAFATRLAEAALEARQRPPIAILVEGESLRLPLEQATSLGLVLLDCINARAESNPRGIMHVLLTGKGGAASLRIVEDSTSGAQPARDMQLLNAIAEQMRGSLVVSAGRDASTLSLSFPTALPALPEWDPLQPVH